MVKVQQKGVVSKIEQHFSNTVSWWFCIWFIVTQSETLFASINVFFVYGDISLAAQMQTIIHEVITWVKIPTWCFHHSCISEHSCGFTFNGFHPNSCTCVFSHLPVSIPTVARLTFKPGSSTVRSAHGHPRPEPMDHLWAKGQKHDQFPLKNTHLNQCTYYTSNRGCSQKKSWM